MIRRIYSDLKSFKALSFDSGLNILLADKSLGATDRQSRNGAGKTSFVELIHFLFGSDVRKDSIFRAQELQNQVFSAIVDINGVTHEVSRSPSKPSRIYIKGEPSGWPVHPDFDPSTKLFELTNEQWKLVLGALWFDIPLPYGNDPDVHRPSFRSAFSYFARRQLSGGFLNPFQHANMQQTDDRQISLSFLLGLDWTLSGKFQDIRSQEKILRELKRAAGDGDLGRYFGKSADLRTKLTVARAKADRLRKQLDEFRVVPEYRELEREANDITKSIDDLNAADVMDGELIRRLKQTSEEEISTSNVDVAKLYEEVGIVLPGLVRRRFVDVEKFHLTIMENRKSHLASEIKSAEDRMDEREKKKHEQDLRRQKIMRLLKSGGALDHYTRLREELGKTEGEAESLRRSLEAAEIFESTKSEINIKREGLTKALREDIHEREKIVQDAVLTFESLSESLYDKAGSLTISETSNGPEFGVVMEGQRSKGITNMQIFCFDMTLAILCHKWSRGPGFLIHDSHLFDGVDERQIAKALQIGAEHAERHKFQYIVTMNSDALPKSGYKAGFNVQDYVMSTRLTDAHDTGGLFGVRFN